MRYVLALLQNCAWLQCCSKVGWMNETLIHIIEAYRCGSVLVYSVNLPMHVSDYECTWHLQKETGGRPTHWVCEQWQCHHHSPAVSRTAPTELLLSSVHCWAAVVDFLGVSQSVQSHREIEKILYEQRIHRLKITVVIITVCVIFVMFFIANAFVDRACATSALLVADFHS